MNKINIATSIILGMIIGFLFYQSFNLKEQNDILVNKTISQNETINTLSDNIVGLISANNITSEKLITMTQDRLSLIEPIRKYNKKEYLSMYKMIMEDSQDAPETIYDVTTDEEFDMICRVVEAEIQNGDFEAKCRVANVIINRYINHQDKGWIGILKEPTQFTTVSNGMYKKVTVSEDTILALEYTWLFGNEQTKDCEYFHSCRSSWHENNLELVYTDEFGHKFYKSKEKEELK